MPETEEDHRSCRQRSYDVVISRSICRVLALVQTSVNFLVSLRVAMSLVLLRTSPNELICRAITHTVAPTYVSRVANVLIMLIDQVRSGQYGCEWLSEGS